LFGHCACLLGSALQQEFIRGCRRRPELAESRQATRQCVLAALVAAAFARSPPLPAKQRYRGWGWNPGTSSWVEPTSVALVVLGLCPKELLPAGANERRQSAEAMLYDRMCPGGGWNCGDPLVYGVPGKPLVIPTAWALLALRRYPQRPENLASLDWLAGKLPDEAGPGSLALAQICLEAYGHKWPATAHRPDDLYSNNEFLGSITTTAWVCLAANSRRSWLTGESGEAAR